MTGGFPFGGASSLDPGSNQISPRQPPLSAGEGSFTFSAWSLDEEESAFDGMIQFSGKPHGGDGASLVYSDSNAGALNAYQPDGEQLLAKIGNKLKSTESGDFMGVGCPDDLFPCDLGMVHSSEFGDQKRIQADTMDSDENQTHRLPGPGKYRQMLQRGDGEKKQSDEIKNKSISQDMNADKDSSSNDQDLQRHSPEQEKEAQAKSMPLSPSHAQTSSVSAACDQNASEIQGISSCEVNIGQSHDNRLRDKSINKIFESAESHRRETMDTETIQSANEIADDNNEVDEPTIRSEATFDELLSHCRLLLKKTNSVLSEMDADDSANKTEERSRSRHSGVENFRCLNSQSTSIPENQETGPLKESSSVEQADDCNAEQGKGLQSTNSDSRQSGIGKFRSMDGQSSESPENQKAPTMNDGGLVEHGHNKTFVRRDALNAVFLVDASSTLSSSSTLRQAELQPQEDVIVVDSEDMESLTDERLGDPALGEEPEALLVSDAELRAVLDQTHGGNDVSDFFPSMYEASEVSAFSDDGMGEELGALDALRDELQAELQHAESLSGQGVLPQILENNFSAEEANISKSPKHDKRMDENDEGRQRLGAEELLEKQTRAVTGGCNETAHDLEAIRTDYDQGRPDLAALLRQSSDWCSDESEVSACEHNLGDLIVNRDVQAVDVIREALRRELSDMIQQEMKTAQKNNRRGGNSSESAALEKKLVQMADELSVESVLSMASSVNEDPLVHDREPGLPLGEQELANLIANENVPAVEVIREVLKKELLVVIRDEIKNEFDKLEDSVPRNGASPRSSKMRIRAGDPVQHDSKTTRTKQIDVTGLAIDQRDNERTLAESRAKTGSSADHPVIVSCSKGNVENSAEKPIVIEDCLAESFEFVDSKSPPASAPARQNEVEKKRTPAVLSSSPSPLPMVTGEVMQRIPQNPNHELLDDVINVMDAPAVSDLSSRSPIGQKPPLYRKPAQLKIPIEKDKSVPAPCVELETLTTISELTPCSQRRDTRQSSLTKQANLAGAPEKIEKQNLWTSESEDEAAPVVASPREELESIGTVSAITWSFASEEEYNTTSSRSSAMEMKYQNLRNELEAVEARIDQFESGKMEGISTCEREPPPFEETEGSIANVSKLAMSKINNIFDGSSTEYVGQENNSQTAEVVQSRFDSDRGRFLEFLAKTVEKDGQGSNMECNGELALELEGVWSPEQEPMLYEKTPRTSNIRSQTALSGTEHDPLGALTTPMAQRRNAIEGGDDKSGTSAGRGIGKNQVVDLQRKSNVKKMVAADDTDTAPTTVSDGSTHDRQQVAQSLSTSSSKRVRFSESHEEIIIFQGRASADRGANRKGWSLEDVYNKFEDVFDSFTFSCGRPSKSGSSSPPSVDMEDNNYSFSRAWCTNEAETSINERNFSQGARPGLSLEEEGIYDTNAGKTAKASFRVARRTLGKYDPNSLWGEGSV